MGQSQHKETRHDELPSSTTTDVTQVLPAPRAPPLTDTDGLAFCDRHPEKFALLSAELQDRLSLPYQATPWRLMYTTREGRSFPRLVRQICNGGPTLTVCELQHGDMSLVFAAYNKCSWKSLAERRGESSSCGSSGASSGYFGDPNCCLIALTASGCVRLDPAYGAGREPPTASGRNFMYLVDEPNTMEMGIGMGGRPGLCAWFVGEDLESCITRPATTFRPSSLFEGDNRTWAVLHFDVFALEPHKFRPLEARRDAERKHLVRQFAMDAAGVTDSSNNKQSILQSDGASTAMAILQLGGAHTSYAHEREDVCCSAQRNLSQ